MISPIDVLALIAFLNGNAARASLGEAEAGVAAAVRPASRLTSPTSEQASTLPAPLSLCVQPDCSGAELERRVLRPAAVVSAEPLRATRVWRRTAVDEPLRSPSADGLEELLARGDVV